MDMTVLLGIQTWRTPLLDKIMVILFHTVIDEKGLFLILLALILLALKKTRRYGGLMLLTIALVFVSCNLILKNIICRPRPFIAYPEIQLLTKAPNGYSCPSVHTAFSFGGAVTVLLKNKRAGRWCLLFAVLIGFSRLYFFVHYPSDVLLGAVLGSLCALAAAYIENAFSGRRLARHKKQ